MQAKKKEKKNVQQKHPVEYQISKRGWKIILSSIFCLAVGFFLLKFTNPEGTNWASIVSPIIIILSYIFIAIGILIK